MQYETTFLQLVSGEVLMFSELCRYFQTKNKSNPMIQINSGICILWSEATAKVEMSCALVSMCTGDRLLDGRET